MRLPLIVLALILAVILPATLVSAAETIDAEYTIEKGGSAEYTSDSVPGGVNALYFDQGGGVGGDESCSKDVDTYCETILIELSNPVDDDGDPATNLTARRSFTTTLTTDAADYDMFLYASDADGNKGAELGRSTAFPLGDTSESVSSSITTSEEQPSVHVMVQVVFFAPATPMTLDMRF